MIVIYVVEQNKGIYCIINIKGKKEQYKEILSANIRYLKRACSLTLKPKMLLLENVVPGMWLLENLQLHMYLALYVSWTVVMVPIDTQSLKSVPHWLPPQLLPYNITNHLSPALSRSPPNRSPVFTLASL